MRKNKVEFRTLEAELKLKGMDLQDFAEALGMPYATVRRRMNREIDWSLTEIKNISKVLGKSVDYLFEIKTE